MKQSVTGLRARLLALVALALTPALGLVGYGAVTERQEAWAKAERHALGLVRVAAQEQRALIAGTRELLLGVSRLAEIKDTGAGAKCGQLFAELRKLHPYYANVGAARTDGTVYCSAIPYDQSVNIADRAYFSRALRSRDFAIGSFQVGYITGIQSINFGHAVVDDKNEVKAVVFAALDLVWLNRLLGADGLPSGSTVSIIDGDGTVLAHAPDAGDRVGRREPDTELVRTILARNAAGAIETNGADGVARLHAFAPLHGSASGELYVSIGIPKAVALSGTEQSIWRNVLLLCVMAALMLAAVWFGSEALVLRPIISLTNAARRVRAGDLMSSTVLTGEAGEIGELARAFTEMAGTLYRVNRAHKTLSETKRLVLRATDELALLPEMCRIVVRQVGYKVTYIVYAGEDEQRLLQPMAHEGFIGGLPTLKKTLENVSWEAGRGPVATTIRTGKPYVIQHLMTDPNFAPWRGDARQHGVASATIFPINVEGQVIGALAIYAAEPDAFEREELELLAEAVQDLSVGIALLRARVEQGRAHATIERMAHYDRLTGLPNHALFEDRLRRALSEARSFDRTLAAFIIDMNRLRDINDAFGFHHGDRVLKEVSVRIGRILRPNALLARMRGDEFAVLCWVADMDDAERVALQIIGVLSTPFAIGSVSIDIDATVGISLYPQHGKDGQRLMRHADVAMHEAKKSGKRHVFYTREQDEDRAQRLAMVGELRRAIESEVLALCFQPKINMRDRNICGVEALVRWPHPGRGMLPPDKFIGLAEQSGLIKPLTAWVIAAALRQSAIWRRHDVALPVAVNLSAYSLRDGGLVETVQQLLHAQGAEAGWLELEITEGAMMEDPEGALDVLKGLREMGITLSIDDFGTGYSSLGYLKKLPVNAVKIDKSFVIDMMAEQDSEAIVRTTISLGHELGLKVVAEGVETREALDHLSKLGCDVAQGYFISKPVPGEDLLKWIQQGSPYSVNSGTNAASMNPRARAK